MNWEEIAKRELEEYFKKHRRAPTRDVFCQILKRYENVDIKHLIRTERIVNGINNYWKILVYFGYWPTKAPKSFYESSEGIKFAIEYMKRYKEKFGRFPNTKMLGSFPQVIREKYGSWNFIEEKLKKKSKWEGKEGFNLAKKIIYEKFGNRTPTIDELKSCGLSGFLAALWEGKVKNNKGVIKNYWDFLKEIGKEPSRRKWKSFYDAIEWGIKFYEKEKRFPRSREAKGILKAIQRGRFQVKSWKEYISALRDEIFPFYENYWNELIKFFIDCGMEVKQAIEKVYIIASFFGNGDRVLDKILTKEERGLFYLLEEEGFFKTKVEEEILFDGEFWKTYWWIINKKYKRKREDIKEKNVYEIWIKTGEVPISEKT